MKKLFRYILLFIISLGGLVVFINIPSAFASDTKVNIDFSCTMAPGSVIDLATVEFKNMVEERSNGRISITLYRHGQLYDPKGEIEAIARGGLKMAILTNLGGRSPALDFIGGFGVQGCTTGVDQYWKFLDTEEVQQIAEGEFISKVNAKLLSMLSYGSGIIGNSKRPIHNIEDYQGLKMRAAGSAQSSLFQALKMIPVQMSSKEVYLALQRGTIDGAPSGPERFLQSKWYEVTKYLTQDYTTPDIACWLAINLDFWNGLTKEDQAVLVAAANDLKKWTRIQITKTTEESCEKLQSLVKDFYYFPESEVNKINNIAGPIMHDLIIKTAGKEIGDKLWALLLNAR